MSTLNLADGESFIKGRSSKKAAELLDLAGDRSAEVRSTSYGYIVPTEILPEGYDAITRADLPAVTTEPNTPKDPADVWNVAQASKDPVGTPLAEADQAPAGGTPLSVPDGKPVQADGEGYDPRASALQEQGAVQFNPSTATVDQVNEYLAGADETERERVLAAEVEGKNRKGIVDAATTSEEGK